MFSKLNSGSLDSVLKNPKPDHGDPRNFAPKKGWLKGKFRKVITIGAISLLSSLPKESSAQLSVDKDTVIVPHSSWHYSDSKKNFATRASEKYPGFF